MQRNLNNCHSDRPCSWKSRCPGRVWLHGTDEFAKRLTIDWKAIPRDLLDLELLKLVDAICEGRGRAVTLEYWIKALALNTGDDKVSDFIYWPEQYRGDGYDERVLTPAEILDIALAKRRSAEY